MKKLIVILAAALACSSCDEEAVAAAILGSAEVHFTLAESYGEFVEVTIDDDTRSVAPGTGAINPCDGGNYVGVGTFLFVSGATKSYVVRDLGGEQVGSGTVTADADCLEVFLN